VGIIAGVTCSAVAAVLLAGMLAYWHMKRKHRHGSATAIPPSDKQMHTEPHMTGIAGLTPGVGAFKVEIACAYLLNISSFFCS
jgi:hypothetical protein